MKKVIFFIFFGVFLLAGLPARAQAVSAQPDISIKNGDIDFSKMQDIPGIELISTPIEPVLPEKNPDDDYSVGEAFLRYLRIYTYFNLKYPDSKINGDLQPDLRKLFPEYSDFDLEEKEEHIRTVVRMYRGLDDWVSKIAARIMTPKEPPLIVEDSEYAEMYQGKYIESDKLVVIMDFKKVIPYAGDKRNFEAVEAKLERDRLKESARFRRFKDFTNKISKIELSKIPYYGSVYPDPFTGNQGVGKWVRFDAGIARLTADSTALGNFGEVRTVLHIMIPSGMYLKDIADSKIKISFDGSRNLAGYHLFRPVPKLLADGEKNQAVFAGEAAFPVTVYARDFSLPLDLHATVTGDFCTQVHECKKLTFAADLTLSAGIRKNSTMRHFVNQKYVLLPKEENDALRISGVWLDAPVSSEDKPSLRVVFDSKSNVHDFKFFTEVPNGFGIGLPKISIDGKKAVVRAEVSSPDIAGKNIEITAQSAPTIAIRQTHKIDYAPFFDFEGNKLTLMLVLMAVAGGAILNIMPCVFPVLSLKILALSGFGAGKKVRRNTLMIIFGIFAAFAVMTTLLVLLKTLGYAIGWGMQFQSPSFLWIMIFVLLLFIAQIAGWINLKTPERINRLLDSKAKEEDLQNFFIGLFLVALSTPCSAPYLGTAIGFALAGSISDIIIIMTAVGFGLALPYLLLFINPQLAMFVPHPGKWMQHLTKIMTLMLLATIMWLVSVLAAQVADGVTFRAVVYILLALGLLAFRKAIFDNIEIQDAAPDIKLKLEKIFNIAFSILFIIILTIGLIDVRQGYSRQRLQSLSKKQIELSLPEITRYIRQGKTVLVAVEADWCLTCKFNNLTVLNNYALKDALRLYDVQVIEIDWTNYNAEVLKFMEAYGRKGLPFYIIYSPKVPNGMVLPEILNEQNLIEIIKNISVFR